MSSNGDLAFFNRQPTLERSSIGVHRVIVIQDPSVHTFQFNVLTCVNYNADFDGDQMNLWVARNPGARAEAMIMSPIANWFISTKTSGPVNGQVQDSTVGCNELTRDTVRIDKFHAMALFATTGTEPPRFDLKPADHIYTGRDIVSLLLSATPINYSRAPSSYSDVYAPYIPFSPTETLTVIERGVLVRGVLDKKSVGAGANGGIFHLISREYGSQRALDVIYALQQIALPLPHDARLHRRHRRPAAERRGPRADPRARLQRRARGQRHHRPAAARRDRPPDRQHRPRALRASADGGTQGQRHRDHALDPRQHSHRYQRLLPHDRRRFEGLESQSCPRHGRHPANEA
jgi:hypothetical protein